MVEERNGHLISPKLRCDDSHKNEKDIISGLLEISQAIAPIGNLNQVAGVPQQEAAMESDNNPQRNSEANDDLSYLLNLYEKMTKVNEALGGGSIDDTTS